jgi:very-short-patch-repair endonuclease
VIPEAAVAVKKQTALARRLRRDMTEAEKRLWWELRQLGLPNRFRRQHPIGRHIVDFACPAAKLAIELDGGQYAIRSEADHTRSEEIAGHGYRIIRFWNGDVMENLAGVLQTIRGELEVALSAPGGGEGQGEVGGAPAPDCGATHLTLVIARATGPLPLRPQGGEGESHVR